MTEDVTISFRSRIEAGDHKFVVPILRKFVDNHVPNRKFGFESITLMPEYQNTQAYAYKLDSKAELETPVHHPLQFQVMYGPNYYSKDVPGKVWSYVTSLSRIADVLVSINNFFDQNKPPGTFLPPVFFDWIHLDALDEGQTVRTFVENNGNDAYGEEFNAAKHATWLPPSLSNKEFLNNCIFPTTTDEEYLDGVRIRMWVCPNTTITFSNQNLPTSMGFQDAQIPEKTKRGQVPFVNQDTTNYKMFFAHDVPNFEIPVTDVRGTKINSYVTAENIYSPVGTLKTTKENERHPKTLFNDLAPDIEKLAKSINMYMTLRYDEATQKFSFKYPNNPNVSIRTYVPATLRKQLGFESSATGDFIDQKAVAESVASTIDTDDLAKKATALVYDTGMVTVDLYQQGSQLNSHSGNTLMATLHPKLDGTLRNRIYYGDMPRVHISHTNPDMNFALYRFDDDNVKQSLGWPVGAYIFGTLTGKV